MDNPVSLVSRVRPYLMDFQRLSYVHDISAALQSYGITPGEVIDCSLGTNPYGCSPGLAEAFRALDWSRVASYPDPTASALKRRLCSFWSDVTALEPEQIFLGTGSMGVLGTINRLLVGPGRRVLGYCPQFTEYMTEVLASGGTYEYVALDPAREFFFDPQDIIDRMDDGLSLVYIDNPNNPTGQIITLPVLATVVRAALALNIPVIVDETYGDFMDRHNSALKLTDSCPNLFVVRSFSKGSGLANLRVGYGVNKGPLREYLAKVDLPFILPDCAAALAAASLSDEQFVIDCRRRVAAAKARVIAACTHLIVARTSPETPILTLGHPNPGIDLYDAFLRLGVLTEAGADFVALGQNFVRLRVPAEIEPLLERIKKLQAGI